MKNFKLVTVTILLCLFYLTNYAQVNSGIFLSSAYDYSSGLINFNSVSTASSNTNAAFTNSALMVNSRLNAGINRGRFDFSTFNYQGKLTDFIVNRTVQNHAFGTYLKTAQYDDLILNNTDTTFGESNYLAGLAYAYRLSDKWSVGANLNYYAGQFNNKTAAKATGLENYHGLTFSVGGLYQDDFEINHLSSINWSVGANINNIGKKNAPNPDRKDKEFMWTQAGFGTSLGYKRASALHPFAVHTTLMYQLNYLLTPNYQDSDNDGILDRESMSALEGIYDAIENGYFYNFQYHTGLEVNVILENRWNFGFRTTFTQRFSFYSNLHPAIFIGYKNFHLSVGQQLRLRQFSSFDFNQKGVSISYNLPF